MVASSKSPALSAREKPRPPVASPALLSLQAQGLEMSSQSRTQISHLRSNQPEENKRVSISPLSISSRSAHLRTNDDNDGIGTASSVDEDISDILKLYINSSRLSLKSVYEDQPLSPFEDGTPLPTILHEPKAYRDTIAPLLEHQFSDKDLVLPAMHTPASLAALPVTSIPDVFIPPLHPTPGTAPIDKVADSDSPKYASSSLQATPKTSSLVLAADAKTSSESRPGKTQDGKIVLEVPDVRYADSWYDKLISPVSNGNTRNSRFSDNSVVSPMSADTARLATYNMSDSSINRPSLSRQPVPRSNVLPRLAVAKLVCATIDQRLSDHRSSLRSSRVSGQYPQPSTDDTETYRRVPDTNMDRYSHKDNPNEELMHTYQVTSQLSPPEARDSKWRRAEASNMPCRPSSALDDSSNTSENEFRIRSHIKSIWKGRSSNAKGKDNKTSRKSSCDDDDEGQETYKHRYWSTYASQAPSGYSIGSHYHANGQADPRLRSKTIIDEFGLPNRPPGECIPCKPWDPEDYESFKKRDAQKGKQKKKVKKVKDYMIPASASEGTRAYSRASTPVFYRMDAVELREDFIEAPKKSRTTTVYNDHLFAASGGVKGDKRRIIQKMFMSNEEKRKDKMKNSITIVGGQKMGNSVGISFRKT